jgi:acetoin utilization deacetylase AcuC-like enzyme
MGVVDSIPLKKWDYNSCMKTIYAYVPSRAHEYPDHPERPGRLDVLEPMLDSFGAESIEASPATHEQIARVHDSNLIHALEEACKQAPAVIDYAPTYITQTSYEDAMLAAGGVITCARAVINGDAKNAFAIIRPPGHHAEPSRAMGFCIFNNIAVAARDALANGLERVMIIDYDAHHGNGTQAAFLNEERVAFLSAHQWGIYPGTGWIDDAPHARKRIVNLPFPSRAGDTAYLRAADEIFVPFARNFRPQLILVSAGFDSHWNDPLTSLGLSTRGFFSLSKKIINLAEEHCGGKTVFVLEGGYDPHNVARGAESVFAALTDSTAEVYAGDPNPHKEPDCESRIEQVKSHHGF